MTSDRIKAILKTVAWLREMAKEYAWDREYYLGAARQELDKLPEQLPLF